MPLDFTKSTVPPPSLGRKPKVQPGFVPAPTKPKLSQVKAGLREVGGVVGNYKANPVSSFNRKSVEQYKAYYRAEEMRAKQERQNAPQTDGTLPIEPTRSEVQEYLTYARKGEGTKPDWVPSHYEPWTIHKCQQLAAMMKGSLKDGYTLGKTVPTMTIFRNTSQASYEFRLEDQGFLWRWVMADMTVYHYQEDLLADSLFHELNRALVRLGVNVKAKEQREYQHHVRNYTTPIKPSYIWEPGPEVTWPDRF